MATGTEQAAEEAFRSAEERFLVDDLDGALRVARNAKRHLASLPALQSALAAYEVHAAARGGGRNCWYAVLSVGVGQPEPVRHDHDAIKKRYRRLCLVLHPDKNRSAAADGAFKLLQRAWEVLSVRHPPGAAAPAPGPGSGANANANAKPRAPPPPTGASPDPGSDWWSSSFRYKPPPERTWQSYGYTPPPPPFSSPSSVNFDEWRSTYASKKGTAYCGHCGSDAAGGGGHRGGTAPPGGRCHSCGTTFNSDPPPPPPQPQQQQSHSQSQAEEGASAPPPAAASTAGAEPPPPPRDPPPPSASAEKEEKFMFRCPGECFRCETPFSALVYRGLCKVRCQACSYDAYVYVFSPDRATAF